MPGARARETMANRYLGVACCRRRRQYGAMAAPDLTAVSRSHTAHQEQDEYRAPALRLSATCVQAGYHAKGVEQGEDEAHQRLISLLALMARS